MKIKYVFIFFLCIIYYKIIIKEKLLNKLSKPSNSIKKIGVFGYTNDNNIGNNLVKFSMFLLLKDLGFEPTMIAPSENYDLYFIKKYMNIREIQNFSLIKKDDYDILMVNSDQTWSERFEYLLNIGFLYFASNWSVIKFTYGASLGSDSWNVTPSILSNAKILVKSFKSISVREKNAINIIQHYLGVKPVFVLDPTFLINKNKYINLIQNFNYNISLNYNYLCVYQLDKNEFIENFIKETSIKYNMKILYVDIFKPNYIEKFIFSYNISKAIITDSYHGTVFSIIFNKPFISFINSERGRDRFISLRETFKIQNRIVFPLKSENIDMNLLNINPSINETEFNLLKEKSLNYLKKNLGILNV